MSLTATCAYLRLRFLEPIVCMLFTGAILVTTINQSTANESSQRDLFDKAWLLERMGGSAISAEQPRLVFSQDGAITGHAGCNQYFGTAELTGHSITLLVTGTSRMACAMPLMKVERRYLQFLEDAVVWDLRDNSLVMSDAKGDEVLRFVGGIEDQQD